MPVFSVDAQMSLFFLCFHSKLPDHLGISSPAQRSWLTSPVALTPSSMYGAEILQERTLQFGYIL